MGWALDRGRDWGMGQGGVWGGAITGCLNLIGGTRFGPLARRCTMFPEDGAGAAANTFQIITVPLIHLDRTRHVRASATERSQGRTAAIGGAPLVTTR